MAHYHAVTQAAPGLPVVIYNVPGRTGLNVLPSTLAMLWENPQLVAVKESSGNLAQIAEVARTLPLGKTLLSGDDNLALASIAVGASGLVSVIGNVLPGPTKQLVDLALAGERSDAIAMHQALLPLMDALFLESNPIPTKAALAIRGSAATPCGCPWSPPARRPGRAWPNCSPAAWGWPDGPAAFLPAGHGRHPGRPGPARGASSRPARGPGAGAARAAFRDAAGAWRANAWVKTAILAGFRSTPTAPVPGWPSPCFDRTAFPPRGFELADGYAWCPAAARCGAGPSWPRAW